MAPTGEPWRQANSILPLRYLLRLLGAIAGLAISAFGLAAVGPEVRYALAGHPRAWSLVALAVIVWFIGLWGAVWAAAARNPLGRRRSADAARPPRRFWGVRLALAYAGLASAYLLSSLPWPPTASADWTSATVLSLLFVGALVGGAAVGRPSAVGRWVILIGGAWGAFSLARAAYAFRETALLSPAPGIVWSAVLAGSIFVMWILAALVVLTTWHAWPERGAASLGQAA